MVQAVSGSATRDDSVSIPKRIWRLNRQTRRLTWLAVALGTAAAMLFVAQAILLSQVVARVFLGGQNRHQVLALILLMLAFVATRALLLSVQERATQRAASHLKRDLRGRLTAHLLWLGPAYTGGERSGELVSTAVSGVEALDAYIAQYLPARYLAAIVPVLIFLIVLAIDPWTTLVLLFAGPMLILIMALIGQRTRQISERRFVELSWMSAFFLDILQGLPTLKLYGRSREQIDNIRAISNQFGSTTMELLATAFQSSLVMEWAAVAATAMVALELSLRVMAGALPFDRALAVLLLTPEFFLPLRQMALKYHAGTVGKTAAERIFGLLDEKHPPVADPEPAQAPARPYPWPNGGPGAIRLQDVVVTYRGRAEPALNGVTLTIPQGKKVALVGPTGAGKSSVATLLLRFIEPDAGTISVGGVPLREKDADDWRAQVAWVPQHPHLFHGTVAENLRLARPAASQAQLEAAARAAHAHDFIVALPRGYDTPVGEQGARLSGGQRQRLAIARAYLQDAPVLILDEVTANLDAESEAAVRDALRRLARGRTVLIIAHRLEMAVEADDIVVLQGGRVVEQGSHDDLLHEGRHYRRLLETYGGGLA